MQDATTGISRVLLKLANRFNVFPFLARLFLASALRQSSGSRGKPPSDSGCSSS